MGNFIDYIAILINFGIPVIFVILVLIYASKKIKDIENKLDKIISLLEKNEYTKNK